MAALLAPQDERAGRSPTPAAAAVRPAATGSAQVAEPPGEESDGRVGVQVRRSTRRRRTVTAYRDGGTVVVCIPAAFTYEQERLWVDRMLGRLQAQESRRRPSDADLARRAAELSERYLGGRPRPTSVRWVANQTTRWGSTTTSDGTIRLSDRLQGTPSWVVDYVLVHELAHLLEHGHGEAFWALVAAYPRAERARGYLEGFAAARDLTVRDDEAGDGGASADLHGLEEVDDVDGVEEDSDDEGDVDEQDGGPVATAWG